MSLTPNTFYYLSPLTLKQFDLFTFPSNWTPTFAHCCYQTHVWFFVCVFLFRVTFALKQHINWIFSIRNHLIECKPFQGTDLHSFIWLLCISNVSQQVKELFCAWNNLNFSLWWTILLKEPENKERRQMYEASVGQLILGFYRLFRRPLAFTELFYLALLPSLCVCS